MMASEGCTCSTISGHSGRAPASEGIRAPRLHTSRRSRTRRYTRFVSIRAGVRGLDSRDCSSAIFETGPPGGHASRSDLARRDSHCCTAPRVALRTSGHHPPWRTVRGRRRRSPVPTHTAREVTNTSSKLKVNERLCCSRMQQPGISRHAVKRRPKSERHGERSTPPPVP